MESRNASLFEDVFPYGSKEKPSSSKRVLETIHENSQDEDTDGEVEPRRSKRARTEKSFGPDFLTYMLEGEPQTYKKAVNSTESLMWKEAIKSEIDSILYNHTWELVDLPSGCKPLSSKWIFKRKRKVDGSIDKYKARLMIKGYRQTEGLDYFDTYSSVTRINSIRMVLAIAAVMPRFPVRPDWRIRTGFREARLNTGTLYLNFFFKAKLVTVGMAHIL